MGADFIYTIGCVDEPKDVWLQRIAGLTLEQAKGIFEGQEWLFGDACEMEDDDEFLEAIKTNCIDAINVAYDCAQGNSRWADVLILNKHKYVLTGGISYGDSPTDIFDDIGLFQHLNYLAEEGLLG